MVASTRLSISATRIGGAVWARAVCERATPIPMTTSRRRKRASIVTTGTSGFEKDRSLTSPVRNDELQQAARRLRSVALCREANVSCAVEFTNDLASGVTGTISQKQGSAPCRISSIWHRWQMRCTKCKCLKSAQPMDRLGYAEQGESSPSRVSEHGNADARNCRLRYGELARHGQCRSHWHRTRWGCTWLPNERSRHDVQRAGCNRHAESDER